MPKRPTPERQAEPPSQESPDEGSGAAQPA